MKKEKKKWRREIKESDKVGGCKEENWKMQIEKVKLLDIGSYSPIETYKSWVV